MTIKQERNCSNCGTKYVVSKSKYQCCGIKCRADYIKKVGVGVSRCLQCGKEYNQNFKKQKFCSKICGVIYNNISRKIKKECCCKNCGKIFMPKTVDRTTFCSRECSFAYKTRIKQKKQEDTNIVKEEKLKKICEFCGKIFIGNRVSSKYCSSFCSGQATYKKAKDNGKTVIWNSKKKKEYRILKGLNDTKNCIVCGNSFKLGDIKISCCSAKCKDIALKNQKRDRKALRRAREKCVYAEKIKIQIVIKRDAGVCQICGKKVLISKKCPHPLSATIDHIIPLSKGGHHSYKNIQLAHFICNCKKNDKTSGVQLRLFG